LRLWSLHPQYLDTRGLVALWREALLAQKVLRGRTAGYKRHPQLERFKAHSRPAAAIAAYLFSVWQEAERRSYRFNLKKIVTQKAPGKIRVTRGQLRYEFRWLCRKLKRRSPALFRRIHSEKTVQPHPFFKPVRGPVEKWERVKSF
jgi:hypothetical protein